MQKHNKDMEEKRAQMDYDINTHKETMKSLLEENEKNKQRTKEEIEKANLEFTEKMKKLEEKQKNINDNHEMILKTIKEDYENEKAKA